jgi:lipoprotein-anchoring transpeptidase ErfK/SrfK
LSRICLALVLAGICAVAPLAEARAPKRPQRSRAHAHAHPRPKVAGKPRPAPLDPAAVNDPGLTAPVGPGSSGAAVLRAQVLLARAHFSCGEIDARYGSNLRKAIAAFQRSRSLPVTGSVDEATWRALDADVSPALIEATIAPEDVAGPFAPVPEEMEEKAKLPALAYSSPLEALAEKYRASPALLKELNPGAAFDQAGQPLRVPNVLLPPPGKAARVVVSRSDRSVEAQDAGGRTLAYYPATIGSDHDPLPVGQWKIRGVSRNPEFHYNPDLFWDAKGGEGKARIAPGPNNPVGVAWIDLSRRHYGIHGTPEPSRVGKSESHGCIRLTNWDVWELQQMVSPGTPALLEE